MAEVGSVNTACSFLGGGPGGGIRGGRMAEPSVSERREWPRQSRRARSKPATEEKKHA
jgi:hypothetical protein